MAAICVSRSDQVKVTVAVKVKISTQDPTVEP